MCTEQVLLRRCLNWVDLSECFYNSHNIPLCPDRNSCADCIELEQSAEFDIERICIFTVELNWCTIPAIRSESVDTHMSVKTKGG